MRTTKILSIVGIVLSSISLLGYIICAGDYDYFAASGWGFLAIAYLLAFSIVATVQTRKSHKNKSK